MTVAEPGDVATATPVIEVRDLEVRFAARRTFFGGRTAQSPTTAAVGWC